MQFSAVYPISANPPTNGHADILARGSRKFTHIYWVAARNLAKELMFSDEERIEMMRLYVKHSGLDNVTVDCCNYAVMRYAEERGARFLLRGLRNTTDFQQEIEMASANHVLSPNVETVCFMTRPGLSTMSSSIVRELARLGEDFGVYVIPPVEALIKKKIGQ